MDGDASTRYSTGTGQAPGQYLQVDFGQGTGQFTTVGLNGAPVRYVRMPLTASSGNWWSVADVRAYTAGEER